jgi:hypothetical protein
MRWFRKRELTQYELFIKESDWFARTSWFSLYFWSKLKIMLLNFIYSLYTSLEKATLRRYAVEIEFYTPQTKSILDQNRRNNTNHGGDFKCHLPLILEVRNLEEVHFVQSEIVKQILNMGYTLISTGVLKEAGTPQALQHNLDVFKNKHKATQKGILNLETRTIKPVPEDEKSEDGKDYNVPDEKYSFRQNQFQFSIVRTRPNANYLESDLSVIITKDNTTE